MHWPLLCLFDPGFGVKPVTWIDGVEGGRAAGGVVEDGECMTDDGRMGGLHQRPFLATGPRTTLLTLSFPHTGTDPELLLGVTRFVLVFFVSCP